MFYKIFFTHKRRIRRRFAKPTAHYLTHKGAAREMVKRKIGEWCAAYAAEGIAFAPKRVAIRNTRSRWGSCSQKGNLNFNYRIALLPEHLADYIVVHGLCHLGEFNHSPRFWALVARAIPNWQARRTELRVIDLRRFGKKLVDIDVLLKT